MELRKVLQSETVTQVGYRAPVCVHPDATVNQALAIMQEHKVGCLLVVEGEALRGIFTERDLLRRVLITKSPMTTPVRQVMTPKPIVARTDESIAAVLSRMYSGGFRHLPVLDQRGRTMGTISMARAVRFIADNFAETVYNLPPEPDRYGDAREGA